MRVNSYFKQAEKIVPDVAGVVVAAVAIPIVLGAVMLLVDQISKIDVALWITPESLSMTVLTATLATAIWIHFSNERNRQSLSYLDKAIDLIKKAYEILSDEEGEVTNDRIRWVTTARLLQRADNISNRITDQAHRHIYMSEHDYWRHQFGELLHFKSAGIWSSFFCGMDRTWSLSRAAICTAEENKGETWIPGAAVSVVYRFSIYPRHYEDPLRSSRSLNSWERDKLSAMEQDGVLEYIAFREHFMCVDKRIKHIDLTYRFEYAFSSLHFELSLR